jgi:hypothetical protein
MLVRARWMLPLALSVALIAVPPLARSQADSPVIRLLHDSRDPRVRVQAATTLGRLRPPGAREALERALGDDNPLVRAAAAQSLLVLRDPAALGPLRARANDRDPGVRTSILRVVRELEGLTAPSTAPGAVAGAPAGGGQGTTDWSRARFLVRLGTLANRASERAAVVDVMRNAIVQEVERHADVAYVLGALPPEAERRVRAGRIRVFAMEGGVNTLRHWTVASMLSVRAEVSLVLMTEPTRTLVGSLSGAATAQDRAPEQDPDAFAQRLEERALAAAVRGAMGNLRASLGAR